MANRTEWNIVKHAYQVIGAGANRVSVFAVAIVLCGLLLTGCAQKEVSIFAHHELTPVKIIAVEQGIVVMVDVVDLYARIIR